MDPKRWSGQAKSTTVLGGAAGLSVVGLLVCKSEPHVAWWVVVGAAAYTVAFLALLLTMTRGE